MAVLYVTEFNTIGGGGNHPISGAQYPAVAEQTVVITSPSTQSAAFNKNTTFIRVHNDVICSIEIGANPTASLTTARMAAGQTEYFSIPPNLNFKIAVITNT